MNTHFSGSGGSAKGVEMPKYIEVLTTEHLALTNELKAARAVVKVASELCAAVDLAEEDIGGARPVRDILADLGPALNAYDAVKPVSSAGGENG